MAENNSEYRTTEKENKSPSNEFCSWCDTTSLSNYYFGWDIFDMYPPEELTELIRHPIENNEVLRKVSLMLYGSNGTFTNTVDYLTAMPTLDKVIVSHGDDKEKCQRNKRLMESTLRIIKDKEIVRDALFKGMVEGVAFYYFETASS